MKPHKDLFDTYTTRGEQINRNGVTILHLGMYGVDGNGLNKMAHNITKQLNFEHLFQEYNGKVVRVKGSYKARNITVGDWVVLEDVNDSYRLRKVVSIESHEDVFFNFHLGLKPPHVVSGRDVYAYIKAEDIAS